MCLRSFSVNQRVLQRSIPYGLARRRACEKMDLGWRDIVAEPPLGQDGKSMRRRVVEAQSYHPENFRRCLSQGPEMPCEYLWDVSLQVCQRKGARGVDTAGPGPQTHSLLVDFCGCDHNHDPMFFMLVPPQLPWSRRH
jgi:hypothetical protein